MNPANGRNEMAGLEGKSGPPGNMNALMAEMHEKASQDRKSSLSDTIMRRLKGIAALIVLSLNVMIIVSCGFFQESCEQSNENKITITQGVWGNVCFWEGNFMPTVDSDRIADRILDIFKSRHGTITPVVREIYICRVITLKEMSDSHVAQPKPRFFSVIPAKFVAITSSDKKGFYQLELPPGTYSVFVKEDDAFYADKFDGEGRITPLEVLPQAMTRMLINLTYKSYE
jgi:hypothetical protein